MTKDTSWKFNWSTADEMRFIDGLGTYPLRMTTSNRKRLHMTKQYLRSTVLRSDWSGMDDEAIKAHAKSRIAELALRIQQYPHIP